MEFVIFLVAAAIFYLAWVVKKGRSGNGHSEELKSPEEMFDEGDYYMSLVVSKSPNLEDYLDTERDKVKAMQKDITRIGERYKHDKEKQREIASDWMDYAHSMYQIRVNSEILDVDWEDTAYDTYDENTKEHYIKIQEIEKRIEDVLGKDSYSKVLNERVNEERKKENERIFGADSDE